MSIDKNHSEQLRKYLNGEMSPKEANALERKSLDDPFIQEAMEGLDGQNTDQVFSDIQELQKQVSAKPNKGFGWMRIAAVIALLMISAFALWFTVKQTESISELAIQEKPMPASPIDSITSETPIVENEEVVAEAEIVKIVEDASIKKDDGVRVADTNELIKEVDELKEVEPVMTLAEADVSKEEITEEIKVGPTKSPFEKTNNTQIAKVAPKTFEMSDINSEKLDSNLLTQSLVASDDAEESVSGKKALSFSTRKMSSQARSARVPREDISSSVLEEVVVSEEELGIDHNVLGYAASKSKVFSRAEPSIGHRKYNNHLKKNLQYPEQAKINEIEGTVTLELTISSEGTISNIDVIKSLGNGCDEEAIRLISEGPDWTAAKSNDIAIEDKVIVKVIFKL